MKIRFLQLLLLAALLGGGALRAAPAAFDFDVVSARAQQLASKPYEARPKSEVPEWLLQLNYDQHRDIRFEPDRSPGGTMDRSRSSCSFFTLDGCSIRPFRSMR